jgi:uncharacterized protein
MKNPIYHLHHFVLIAFVALGAAGCASAPSQFYKLNATATLASDGTTNTNYVVIVGPVTIPAEVDRPQFTVQVEPNVVALDEFNRWAEPLNDNIASAVAGDLAVLLGTPRVATLPLANFGDAWQVSISIQRFESAPGKSALIDAVWVVRPPAGGKGQSGRTLAIEPVSDEDFSSLAAAHSRALAKVSTDIAAAIRASADQKP